MIKMIFLSIILLNFKVFSEFIILFVASLALFLEYRRSAIKEEAKQAALEQVRISMIILFLIIEKRLFFFWNLFMPWSS